MKFNKMPRSDPRHSGTFLSAAKPVVAMRMVNEIVQNALDSGAECMVTACAMCHLNIEMRCTQTKVRKVDARSPAMTTTASGDRRPNPTILVKYRAVAYNCLNKNWIQAFAEMTENGIFRLLTKPSNLSLTQRLGKSGRFEIDSGSKNWLGLIL